MKAHFNVYVPINQLNEHENRDESAERLRFALGMTLSLNAEVVYVEDFDDSIEK